MRIENRSAVHAIEKLRCLLEFAAGYCREAHRVVVRVTDARLRNETGGRSWKRADASGTSGCYSPGTSLVELFVSRDLNYPRKTVHPDASVAARVGSVMLNSWEEEVLFVAAHELAHVDDFFHGVWRGEFFAEVVAEAAAVNVLERWRAGVP